MPPWMLTGAWNEKFRKALFNAFDENAITILMMDCFGINFAAIAPVGVDTNHEIRLQKLINAAKLDDWLIDLVAATYERRPKNGALKAIAEELGLTITGPRLINNTGKSLEEIVQDNAKFIDIKIFIERLPQLAGQVCWIDVPGGGGTGFLIGANLVLTNRHVVERICNGKAQLQDVKCKFDYFQTLDGSELKKKRPIEVGLVNSPEWLVDSKPPSMFDDEPTLGEADESESDYAILRLAEPIGESPIGGDTDTRAQPRGWIHTASDVPVLTQGNQVFLLQHPKGAPLQLTVGTVIEFNHAGTRVRYDANSKDGSSGSPVFDADLNLVAMHHARDPACPPKWNQAIPFSVVKKVWNLP